MSGGGTLIEAREALVRTAQVEIKTLTISGKQVTLALFRQFPEKDWVGGDGKPRGPLWGRVHYRPEKDAREWQLVWQLEDALYRCRQPFSYDASGIPGIYETQATIESQLSRMYIRASLEEKSETPRGFGKVVQPPHKGFYSRREWIYADLARIHPGLSGSCWLSDEWFWQLPDEMQGFAATVDAWKRICTAPADVVGQFADCREKAIARAATWDVTPNLVANLYDEHGFLAEVKRNFAAACEQAQAAAQLFIAV